MLPNRRRFFIYLALPTDQELLRVLANPGPAPGQGQLGGARPPDRRVLAVPERAVLQLDVPADAPQRPRLPLGRGPHRRVLVPELRVEHALPLQDTRQHQEVGVVLMNFYCQYLIQLSYEFIERKRIWFEDLVYEKKSRSSSRSPSVYFQMIIFFLQPKH